MIDSKINDLYPIRLTDDRHEFHTPRPGWEKERLAAMIELTGPGMTVYDIGAECGDFTALYHLWVGQEGTVIPVEPQPQYWPAIRAHWEGNDLPPLQWYFPGFASSITKVVPQRRDEMYDKVVTVDESGWPIASLLPIMPDFGFRHLAQQTIHTPQMAIDAMVLRTKVPDIIVMDIEGAEYDALTGADHVLREIHPIMFVSIHPATMKDWYNRTVSELLSFMSVRGYTGEMLGEDSEQYWLFQ